MKYYAIIVGGGSGTRMKTEIPKQFLPLDGKPVLMHTISAFNQSSFNPEIILVIHPYYHEYWKQLCIEYGFNVPHSLINSGNQRFDSVKNGLKAVKGKAIVAVHDAVRPLVSSKVIGTAYIEAEATGTAVAAIVCNDSVRQISNHGSMALNRNEILLVQTPQTFRSDILKQAYRQNYDEDFTDDASVVERSGVKITMVEGDPRNIKITYPQDIRIAACLLHDENKRYGTQV